MQRLKKKGNAMKKRHILFIFFDQLRYDAIGAMGNPYIQTPALDALANESVVFDRCFTPSPVCVPARLSMLAGQYPARTGNSNNNHAYFGDVHSVRYYDRELTATEVGWNFQEDRRRYF